jgi:hypothetical protein
MPGSHILHCNTMFKALLLEKDEAGFRAGLATLDEARLPEGDVLVQPAYSTSTSRTAWR